ncbi:uncharacterized protein YjaZ [Herbaspirillum rubrisubalbicans]|uniref:DUF2268 domain-containing putative Zn-dependent protease n=1 Tax=Herbaspirillum rubrisubalbicans TaxID=80842 RepID=UPI00209F9F46|nr:DUF2268 domain-containing putative Zn-dependent protease [Herbaspirillum rubrisubalbicans]MCP1572309.1 uncharacterized protein YjaZ [Herbaspirillum rubrisubalbicans]
MDKAGLNLHFLDARGALAPLRSWITAALWETYERASSLISLRPLDVVVQTGKQVIPEKGHLGYSSAPGVIFITVDPTHPLLLPNQNASLERMFAHELHHAARWDGPGYGLTLGEALVSEGMAGHFAQEVWRGEPEPWERLYVGEIQNYLLLAGQQWNRSDYDHGAWFFGNGELPRWLGYSLGYQIVHQYSMMRQHMKASAMVTTDAGEFRACLRLLECATETKSVK